MSYATVQFVFSSVQKRGSSWHKFLKKNNKISSKSTNCLRMDGYSILWAHTTERSESFVLFFFLFENFNFSLIQIRRNGLKRGRIGFWFGMKSSRVWDPCFRMLVSMHVQVICGRDIVRYIISVVSDSGTRQNSLTFQELWVPQGSRTAHQVKVCSGHRKPTTQYSFLVSANSKINATGGERRGRDLTWQGGPHLTDLFHSSNCFSFTTTIRQP